MVDWGQDSHGGLPGTSTSEKKIPHKRVHWRVLVLPDSAHKFPGHVIEVADSSLSLKARYAFPVGTQLQLAIFVPNPKDRSLSQVFQVDGKVSFQVMRGDEVQTGFRVKYPETIRQAIIAALLQEK